VEREDRQGAGPDALHASRRVDAEETQ
jgi:hypothetical protein